MGINIYLWTSKEEDFPITKKETPATCASLTVRDFACPSNSGVPGTVKSTTTRSPLSPEATSSTTVPTPPSNGSSTGSTAESRASSSKDGSSTSVSAFGSESLGSLHLSTSSARVSDSVNTTATPTITSTSAIE